MAVDKTDPFPLADKLSFDVFVDSHVVCVASYPRLRTYNRTLNRWSSNDLCPAFQVPDPVNTTHTHTYDLIEFDENEISFDRFRIYLVHFDKAFVQTQIVPHRIFPSKIITAKKIIPGKDERWRESQLVKNIESSEWEKVISITSLIYQSVCIYLFFRMQWTIMTCSRWLNIVSSHRMIRAWNSI